MQCPSRSIPRALTAGVIAAVVTVSIFYVTGSLSLGRWWVVLLAAVIVGRGFLYMSRGGSMPQVPPGALFEPPPPPPPPEPAKGLPKWQD